MPLALAIITVAAEASPAVIELDIDLRAVGSLVALADEACALDAAGHTQSALGLRDAAAASILATAGDVSVALDTCGQVLSFGGENLGLLAHVDREAGATTFDFDELRSRFGGQDIGVMASYEPSSTQLNLVLDAPAIEFRGEDLGLRAAPDLDIALDAVGSGDPGMVGFCGQQHCAVRHASYTASALGNPGLPADRIWFPQNGPEITATIVWNPQVLCSLSLGWEGTDGTHYGN